jgi:transcriptional regulator with XRE-family HTH domain
MSMRDEINRREEGRAQKTDEIEYRKQVGQRLIEARREQGISQKELSELVHVSERSMQAYEAGEVLPVRKLRDLSTVLGKPIAWILHGERAETTPGELVPLMREMVDKLDQILQAVTRQTMLV